MDRNEAEQICEKAYYETCDLFPHFGEYVYSKGRFQAKICDSFCFETRELEFSFRDIRDRWEARINKEAGEWYITVLEPQRNAEWERTEEEERKRAEEEARMKAELEAKRKAQNEANKKKLAEMQAQWKAKQAPQEPVRTQSALTETIACPQCGNMVNKNSKFCTNCGTKLSVTCPNCGSILKAGTKFCTNCGTPMNK